MSIVTQWPDSRRDSRPVYYAPFVAIGDHARVTVNATTGLWLKRPTSQNGAQEATHVNIFNKSTQVNLRFRYDDGQSTATLGFRIGYGDTSLIPIAGRGISLCAESGTVDIEYQWFV